MSGAIFRDPWGIPHLRADDARELARLQGLVTARDRGWQIEVERHRAQGTSASFLGAGALSWDVLVRHARVADTARRCLTRLEEDDPETADWLQAYVTGVNQGLDGHDAPEFTRAGIRPGRWEPWGLVILEASRGNLFLARGDTLLTAPADGRILPGVTRRRVIELALDAGIEVHEQALGPADLDGADEAFLTGAVRGVEPVRAWEGSERSGEGPVTRMLAARLRELWNFAMLEEAAR